MRMVITLMLACCSWQASAQDIYRVQFAPDLAVVNVRACFDGKAPDHLYHHSEAGRFSLGTATMDAGLQPRIGTDSTRLPQLPPASCISWTIDLNKAMETTDSGLATRVGDDIVMDTDVWLWRGPGYREVRVEVSLPEGMEISVPWRRSGSRAGVEIFEPEKTPATWTSRTAVGRFSERSIDIAGAKIRLAIAGSLPESRQAVLAQWIAHAAGAVGSVHGRYPQRSPQVLVIPIGRRGEAVPWAHVMRGGGVSAEFFVDETRTLEELTADWTVYHELSHMLLPFISSRDRWLPEGLASYYQYVLLARSGKLSEQEAWQGLFEGFVRGQRDTGGGTLAEATLAGWKYTMRVYWSGAAMMLMADTRLRAASEGEQSLDTAMASLQDCCLHTGKRWRASSLFRQLDRNTGTGIFTDLYEQHVQGQAFPDLTRTWQSLGVGNRFRRVRLLDEAPLARVRTSIMSG